MRLGQKQELFAELLPRLIDKAISLGFKVRVGEVLRFEAQARWNSEHCRACKKTKAHKNHQHHTFVAIGILHSLHRQKLAVDLILFLRGQPRWDTFSYTKLGEWWEDQHTLCRWGGRFRDAGHFSITHGGRR